MMNPTNTYEKPHYQVSPQPVRTNWHNKKFMEARKDFDIQCRYITGLLDALFSQGIIAGNTALTLEASIRELRVCVNEIEIAIRRDYQEKEDEDD